MATQCALDLHNKDLTNVREGKSLFQFERDETRMPQGHPIGQCCICLDKTSGLKLTCGHYMCPDDILDWAWDQFKLLQYEIKCGSCNATISIDDVIKLGLPTDAEEQFITAVVALNFCESNGMQPCSQCMSYCVREKSTDVQVRCDICTKKKGKDYWFCWYCVKAWVNWNSHTECGNSNCQRGVIMKLETCATIDFKDSTGQIIKTPIQRACPKCKTVIEYISQCNEMTCSRCKNKFCFICLQSSTGGSLVCSGRNYNTLTCKSAPRQTNLK